MSERKKGKKWRMGRKGEGRRKLMGSRIEYTKYYLLNSI